MHVYIYDTFLNQKKYDATLARVETRATDLGLNGKIIRLGLSHSLYDAVENEIKKGATTVTAAGDNKIFHEIVNVFARLSAAYPLYRDIPLGFIPIGKAANSLAAFFGINEGEAACDILSARRIQEIDLGRINNRYFLSDAKISGHGTIIEIDGNYSIEVMGRGEISVVNLPVGIAAEPALNFNGQDGSLELFIKTSQPKKLLALGLRQERPGVFHFNKLLIANTKNLSIMIDSAENIPTPAEISLAKEKIKVIVGKNRQF